MSHSKHKNRIEFHYVLYFITFIYLNSDSSRSKILVNSTTDSKCHNTLNKTNPSDSWSIAIAAALSNYEFVSTTPNWYDHILKDKIFC